MVKVSINKDGFPSESKKETEESLSGANDDSHSDQWQPTLSCGGINVEISATLVVQILSTRCLENPSGSMCGIILLGLRIDILSTRISNK